MIKELNLTEVDDNPNVNGTAIKTAIIGDTESGSDSKNIEFRWVSSDGSVDKTWYTTTDKKGNHKDDKKIFYESGGRYWPTRLETYPTDDGENINTKVVTQVINKKGVTIRLKVQGIYRIKDGDVKDVDTRIWIDSWNINSGTKLPPIGVEWSQEVEPIPIFPGQSESDNNNARIQENLKIEFRTTGNLLDDALYRSVKLYDGHSNDINAKFSVTWIP